MRLFLTALALALANPALALTDPTTGSWLELSGGGAVVGGALAPQAELSLGAWQGPYDPSYAIGHFQGAGLTLRVAPGDALTASASAEVRGGKDVIVVGWYRFASLGAETRDDSLGALALVGGGARFRLRPHYAVHARLEAGIGSAGGVHGQGALTLGLAWTRPWTHAD
ncbi:MAG: hypothetical protein JXX28_05065 [Deltaproteobacteria bacterium]|nr:hypothetical protein [Deltaproteobacteria bacterium]